MDGGEFQYAKGPQRMQLPLGSTRELGSHKDRIRCLSRYYAECCNGFGFKTLDSSRRAHYFSFQVDGFAEAVSLKNQWIRCLKVEKTKPAPGHEKSPYAGLEEYEEELVRQKRDSFAQRVVEWYRGV